MRGQLTLRILEFLLEEFGPATDIILATIVAGDKTSMRRYKIARAEARIRRGRERLLAKIKDKTSFAKLLYYLKKEGFITDEKQVTTKGLKKLENLKGSLLKRLPIKKYSASELEKDHLKIIIFDIPEKFKNKREWLRLSLLILGFTKLQKSVYIGETELPADFLKKLKELGLLSYVKIFSVYKRGTIDYKE